MRVCMFSMLLPAHVTGGMEIHALELARGIVKAGHEVAVITSRHHQGIEKEVVDGVEIYYTDVDATSKKPLGRKSLQKLEELHAEKRFGVVHSQSFAAFYYVKDGLKQKLGIPLVTTIHGTSFGEIRSNLNQGLRLMLIPKIIFHLYNQYAITKPFVQASDMVIAISKELTESFPKDYGISPAKVRTVYNGIDTERFKPTESKIKGSYKGKRIILTVSVLHKQKGVQYLIEAMKNVSEKFSNVHLVVVGDGPYRKELEALARKLGVEGRVTFAGKRSNEEVKDYYNACEVFAIPTVRVEGLPLIELESMACGKPVVASNIGGIPTVIEDGVNGILVPPGDGKKLSAQLIRVLGDAKLAARLGSEARKTIEKDFSRKSMVENTLKAYGEAILS